ncbi:antibiotic biosynthesis monooxygenase [Streptomyces sp.]|uniref:antibiotic biosynthesis monooxygenase n=1 Tax=Streptomyces sp. TaxID=1931 RepID=UPI002F3E86B3
MPVISAEDGLLTVFNIFTTDSSENQRRLMDVMREVMEGADYPGWISASLHSGVHTPGSANLIQWRSRSDLEARNASDEVFRHRALPVFRELATSLKLLQTAVAFTQRFPAAHDRVELSPEHGHHTVIEIFGVAGPDPEPLIDALGPGRAWLAGVPGYLSHSVLRGLGGVGVEGSFVLVYSQWKDESAHDGFRTLPESEWTSERRSSAVRVSSLAHSYDWNAYRITFSRSAGESGRTAPESPHHEVPALGH